MIKCTNLIRSSLLVEGVITSDDEQYFGDDDDWTDSSCDDQKESKDQVMPVLCSELTRRVIDHANRRPCLL